LVEWRLTVLTAGKKIRAAVAKEVGMKNPIEKQPPARIKTKSIVYRTEDLSRNPFYLSGLQA
jgi:hypothetical protein